MRDAKKGRYCAFIDMLDLVALLAQRFERSRLVAAGMSSALEEAPLTVADVADLSKHNPFAPIEENASVLTCLQAMVAGKLHRVPVVVGDGELVTIVTQSQIVAYLQSNRDLFLPLLNVSLGECKLGYKSVLTCGIEDLAINAFLRMHNAGVSGLAVVDGDGKVVDSLSDSDLKSIGRHADFVHHLYLPVPAFLGLNLDRPQSPATVNPTSTVGETLALLSGSHLHRVYIVDDDGTPAGIVSLIDIIAHLIAPL